MGSADRLEIKWLETTRAQLADRRYNTVTVMTLTLEMTIDSRLGLKRGKIGDQR